jgi:hypothetical protein
MPGWVHLMASTLRLIDADDSNRQPGLLQQASAPDEQRAGASEGAYPTIAWELLEWLRDKEIEGNLDFVDVTPFIDRAAAVHGISPTDGQYIANLLATPTELHFTLGELPSRRSTRDAALIEKQRRGSAAACHEPGAMRCLLPPAISNGFTRGRRRENYSLIFATPIFAPFASRPSGCCPASVRKP